MLTSTGTSRAFGLGLGANPLQPFSERLAEHRRLHKECEAKMGAAAPFCATAKAVAGADSFPHSYDGPRGYSSGVIQNRASELCAA